MLASFAALALLFQSPGAQAAAQGSVASIEQIAERLKADGDNADPQLVHELAGRRTKAALEALLDVYRAMNTTFMRREIARALVLFDEVPEAAPPALQKLMDIAVEAREPELWRAALDGLGECHAHGREFLATIAESRADDSVRERAMELEITLRAPSDTAWYRAMCKPVVEEKPDKDKKRKDAKGGKKAPEDAEPKKPRPTGPIRLLAFQAVAPDLTPDEVVEFTSDAYFAIRRAALLELERRGDKRALELAQAALAKISLLDSTLMILKVDERVEVRVAAAQICGRLLGVKAAPDFIKRATNADTPMELRRALADILAGLDDPSVNRQLVGDLGKGQAHEKLFRLWAIGRMRDDKVDRAIEKLLTDKDESVVIAACRVLAERKDTEAEPILAKLIKGKDRGVARAALESMSVLRLGDPAWLQEILAYAKSEDPELRSLALQVLGATADRSYLPVLVEALQDKVWSTRLAALEALEKLRSKESIAAIIDRMDHEEGRMRMEFADALWRLTGQPFQDRPEAWKEWWKHSGDAFRIPSEEEAAKLRTGEAEWRLKQATGVGSVDPVRAAGVVPVFFGVRVVSHRVIFVFDVSGSMNEELHSAYEGKTGHTRMDVLRKELAKCIQGLDPASYFNLIDFSTGVGTWMNGGLVPANEKNRESAQAFVSQLGPQGSTNLYDALKTAFADPEVDTIFVISDGEPTDGAQTDQLVIRERVKRWNAQRQIVINTIAVGGQFQILEWLAADSRGTHIRFE